MNRRYNVVYQWSNPDSIYAGRTIANGYKNAFTSMGHNFKFLTPDDSASDILLNHKPDIFITAFNKLALKFVGIDLLTKAKKNGIKIFVNVPFWKSPISKNRINESGSISDSREAIRLLSSKYYGDIYFNSCEEDDERMAGFEKVIGRESRTLLLAADSKVVYPENNSLYESDIAYIGTFLPEKRQFFNSIVYPLRKKYAVSIYGQDWTCFERIASNIQKFGQFYNIPRLKNFIKPKLPIEDERIIYTSSTISINIHELYQNKYGDLNERTFKIPLAGGFEIVDNVRTINKYLIEDKEVVVAHDNKDWLEKIDYYINNPEKRLPIIRAGRKKVQKYHTYENRVITLLNWYNDLH